MLVGVKSGNQRGQRRATQGRRYIASSKDRTFGRQAIQVRRFDLGVLHESVVGPCLIVRNYQNDIRRRVLCGYIPGCVQIAGTIPEHAVIRQTH